MVHSQVLSLREKILSIVAGALLIALVIIGYNKVVSAATDVLAPAIPTTPVATPVATPVEKSTNQQAEDLNNQQNHLRGQKDYLKNLQRQVQDIQRDVKNVDTSSVNAILSKFESCITAKEALLGQQGFWDSWQDCNDYSRAVEDELNDKFRPLQRCVEFKKNIDDRRREKKSNIDRQTKDILRNDKTADVSGLNAIAVNIDGGLAKAEGLIAAGCNSDTISTLEDLRSDWDTLFRDWYDVARDVQDKANTARQMTENTKDFEKNIKRQCEKDFSRELKNFEKEIARAQKQGALPEAVASGYGKGKEIYNNLCVTLIQTMQQALTAGDMEAFNDARNEFNNSDFRDTLNEARQATNQIQQAKDALKDLGQREKELVKMKKEYERAVKKAGGDIPEVKQLLVDMETLIIKAKETIQADPQSWWSDYQQQYNDLQNEFWNSQQKVQQAGDVQRWLKDIEKEVTFRERDLKNMKRNKDMDTGVFSELEGILNQMKALVEKARSTVATDPDGARDLLQSMDDLRMQWDETTRSVGEKQQIAFELGKIKRELENARNQIEKLARSKKISGDQANTCLDFIGKVQDLLANTKFESGEDMGKTLGGLEEEAYSVCPVLREMGPPSAPDNRAYYKEFIGENAVGIDKEAASLMLEKVSEDVVAKVIQRLLNDPSTVQNLLQMAGSKYRADAAGTLEAATNFYDESAQRDFITKKAEILDLTNQLEQLKAQVLIAQDKLNELSAIQNELASYNFYGSAGDTIRSEVEAFIVRAKLKGLSKDEIKAGIAQLKTQKDTAIAESKRAKFEAKIIPFMDTDDNVWYTKFIAPLARLGIVKGKSEGTFAPAAQVTVAEILTMAFRISGDPEIGGASSLCNGKFVGHWANKFVSWAEHRGLSIVAHCGDINRPAQRWEVAQVLLETGLGDVETSNNVCFSDVKPNNQPVNSVVCKAQQAGIMRGTDGKSNAYAPVIRAEAATMVKTAAEKLLGIQFGELAQAPQPQKLEQKRGVEEDFSEEEEFGEKEGGAEWDMGGPG